MFCYEGLGIRLVEKEDLDFFMMLRKETWGSLGNIQMLSRYKQEEWFLKISDDKSKDYYVLLKNNERIGLVRTDEIDHINKSIRVGGDILRTFCGLGYGTKMMKLIVKYCFDYLNMNRLWLMVLESNKVARHIYKKVGFMEEGCQRSAIFRNGRYEDYLMMSFLREEYVKSS